MKYERDIEYQTNVYRKLNDKETFLFQHGKFNCKYLKFKDANTVINIMNKYDNRCLDLDSKKFILENSNKEVLCSINRPNELYPDIFVFGDDNIAFQTDCFE